MHRKKTDYPRAMIIDMLELQFEPTEFGVVHTEKPHGYDITWFDGPTDKKVQNYLKKEFQEFSQVYVRLSRKKSGPARAT